MRCRFSTTCRNDDDALNVFSPREDEAEASACIRIVSEKEEEKEDGKTSLRETRIKVCETVVRIATVEDGFRMRYNEEILSTLATSRLDFGFTNARKQSSHSYFSAAYIYKRDDLIIRNNNKLSLCSSFISLFFSCCVLKTLPRRYAYVRKESLSRRDESARVATSTETHTHS